MQYHAEKFILLKSTKKFILDLENLIVNFPKKDYINKDMLYKEALSLLELIYIANDEDDILLKKQTQIKILAKINMLDFYLERAYKKRYISEKQCLNKSNDLSNITKMVYGWIKSNDKS